MTEHLNTQAARYSVWAEWIKWKPDLEEDLFCLLGLHKPKSDATVMPQTARGDFSWKPGSSSFQMTGIPFFHGHLKKKEAPGGKVARGIGAEVPFLFCKDSAAQFWVCRLSLL